MSAPSFVTYDKQLARERLLDSLAKLPDQRVTVFFVEYGTASFNIGVESDSIEAQLADMDRFIEQQRLDRDQMKEVLFDVMKSNKHMRDKSTSAALLVWVLCRANSVIEGLAKDGGHIIGCTFTDRPAPDGGTFLGCRITVQHQDAQV